MFFFEIQVFIMYIKGVAMNSLTGLIKDVGMLLNSVKQSLCMYFVCFFIFSASSQFVFSSTNYLYVKFFGSDFI